MKLLALLALTVSLQAQANPLELYVQLLKDDGPVAVEEVTTETPSPLLTGYQARVRKCDLLVNTKTFQPATPFAIFQVVHEVGHCKALRDGLSVIGEPRANDERIADVFALAWLHRNRPELLEAVVPVLIEHRKFDRRIDARYDTLMAIRMTLTTYPQSKEDPWAFTTSLFVR